MVLKKNFGIFCSFLFNLYVSYIFKKNSLKRSIINRNSPFHSFICFKTFSQVLYSWKKSCLVCFALKDDDKDKQRICFGSDEGLNESEMRVGGKGWRRDQRWRQTVLRLLETNTIERERERECVFIVSISFY